MEEFSKTGLRVSTSKFEEDMMLYFLNNLKEKFGFKYERYILDVPENGYARVAYDVIDANDKWVTSVITYNQAEGIYDAIFHISNFYSKIKIPGIDNSIAKERKCLKSA